MFLLFAVCFATERGEASDANDGWKLVTEQSGVTICSRPHPGSSLKEFKALGEIAATPFTYAGILWLSASEGGWHTQAAAAGLIIGWLALAVGAISVCQAVKAKQRPNLKVVVSSCVAATAAHTIVIEWGGGMLI